MTGDLPYCFNCGNYIYSSGGCPCQSVKVFTYGPVVERKPYKCPCCDGTGKVSRPPWVPGDVDSWTTNQTSPYPCQPCDGKGIVWG